MNDQPTAPSSSMIAIPGVGQVDSGRLAEMRESYARAYVPTKENESADQIAAGRAARAAAFDRATQPPAEPAPYSTSFTNSLSDEAVDRGFENIRVTFGLNSKAYEELRNQPFVTAEERALAESWKTQHMKDSAWVRKYLAGDADAGRLLFISNVILTKAIKPK
jgi:hypothetical protein